MTISTAKVAYEPKFEGNDSLHFEEEVDPSDQLLGKLNQRNTQQKSVEKLSSPPYGTKPSQSATSTTIEVRLVNPHNHGLTLEKDYFTLVNSKLPVFEIGKRFRVKNMKWIDVS